MAAAQNPQLTTRLSHQQFTTLSFLRMQGQIGEPDTYDIDLKTLFSDLMPSKTPIFAVLLEKLNNSQIQTILRPVTTAHMRDQVPTLLTNYCKSPSFSSPRLQRIIELLYDFYLSKGYHPPLKEWLERCIEVLLTSRELTQDLFKIILDVIRAHHNSLTSQIVQLPECHASLTPFLHIPIRGGATTNFVMLLSILDYFHRNLGSYTIFEIGTNEELATAIAQHATPECLEVIAAHPLLENSKETLKNIKAYSLLALTPSAGEPYFTKQVFEVAMYKGNSALIGARLTAGKTNPLSAWLHGTFAAEASWIEHVYQRFQTPELDSSAALKAIRTLCDSGANLAHVNRAGDPVLVALLGYEIQDLSIINLLIDQTAQLPNARAILTKAQAVATSKKLRFWEIFKTDPFAEIENLLTQALRRLPTQATNSLEALEGLIAELRSAQRVIAESRQSAAASGGGAACLNLAPIMLLLSLPLLRQALEIFSVSDPDSKAKSLPQPVDSSAKTRPTPPPPPNIIVLLQESLESLESSIIRNFHLEEAIRIPLPPLLQTHINYLITAGEYILNQFKVDQTATAGAAAADLKPMLEEVQPSAPPSDTTCKAATAEELLAYLLERQQVVITTQAAAAASGAGGADITLDLSIRSLNLLVTLVTHDLTPTEIDPQPAEETTNPPAIPVRNPLAAAEDSDPSVVTEGAAADLKLMPGEVQPSAPSIDAFVTATALRELLGQLTQAARSTAQPAAAASGSGGPDITLDLSIRSLDLLVKSVTRAKSATSDVPTTAEKPLPVVEPSAPPTTLAATTGEVPESEDPQMVSTTYSMATTLMDTIMEGQVTSPAANALEVLGSNPTSPAANDD